MVQMDVQAGCCDLSSHTPSELFQTLPILPEEGREEWMVCGHRLHKDVVSYTNHAKRTFISLFSAVDPLYSGHHLGPTFCPL